MSSFWGAPASKARTAARVVAIYCASAFGGSRLRPEVERELGDRMRRLKKLA